MLNFDAVLNIENVTYNKLRSVATPFFFYKKTVYKNIQAEIPEKIRTSVRTSQPQNMAKKRILQYFGQKLLFLFQNSMTFTYQYQIHVDDNNIGD